MGNYDSDSDSSDIDDFLREEIEALTRACAPLHNASTDPAVGGSGYFLEDDEDDDFDDLELVRSIQDRYGAGVVDDIKPLASLPPPASDDDDDDYEFYQAIKERFSQHVSVGANTSDDPKENNDASCRDKSVPNDFTNTSFGREYVDQDGDDVDLELSDGGEKEGASSFPRTAQTFIEAIKKNRSCQKFVRSKLVHIEAKIEEIKELRKRYKTLRDFQVRCKKTIGRAMSQKQDAHIQLISVRRQRANVNGMERNLSALCYGPHENSYVACYKAALEMFPLSFHRDLWSEEDRQNLVKGIKQQYQEKLLQRSNHGKNSAEELDFYNGVDAMMLSIKNRNITPRNIQRFLAEVNWDLLASRYLPHRSGEECEMRWLNHENSLINSGAWTKEEDSKLLSLIVTNGFHSWKDVAEQLGTNRTSYQCLVRYQRSLNAKILNREWTEDEDAQLCSLVEVYGESNWQAVASKLVGRTGPQCSNRWKKTLHPARQKVGRWGDDEVKRLRVAVTLFGKSWHRISQFVPGRTQVQCRERWVNVSDPSFNRCAWTHEEDMKLKEAIAEHGFRWVKVAACVPMRTDNQCLRRWKTLFPQEFLRLKAARNIQKVALISNFVDREEERPTLGPKDFVSLLIEGSTMEQKRKRSHHRKCQGSEPTEKLPSIGSLKRGKRKKSTTNKQTIARKKPKKNMVDAGEPEEWEDLSLSVLFNTVFARTH